MAECKIVHKPRNFIRQRKLDIISGIIGEANLALEDPARTGKQSHLSPDIGYELLSGKWEQGGFSGLS